jgi:hypothetical protein
MKIKQKTKNKRQTQWMLYNIAQTLQRTVWVGIEQGVNPRSVKKGTSRSARKYIFYKTCRTIYVEQGIP